MSDLNWHEDDGVYFPLLNDKLRNQFYAEALKRACSGKVVLDIGAGTGLLSILAARSGAKKVYAIEKNMSLFIYAKKLISDLKLDETIYLVYGNFGQLNGYSMGWEPIDVVVTETFGGDFFEENILGSLDNLANFRLSSDLRFIPETVNVEAIPIKNFNPEFDRSITILDDSGLPTDLQNRFNNDFNKESIPQFHRFPHLQGIDTLANTPTLIAEVNLKDLALNQKRFSLNKITNLDLNSPQENFLILFNWNMSYEDLQLNRFDYSKEETQGHWDFVGYHVTRFHPEDMSFHIHLDSHRIRTTVGIV